MDGLLSLDLCRHGDEERYKECDATHDGDDFLFGELGIPALPSLQVESKS